MPEKTEKNPRGAGAKPLPYRSKNIRVPLPLVSEFEKLITEFKIKAKK